MNPAPVTTPLTPGHREMERILAHLLSSTYLNGLIPVTMELLEKFQSADHRPVRAAYNNDDRWEVNFNQLRAAGRPAFEVLQAGLDALLSRLRASLPGGANAQRDPFTPLFAFADQNGVSSLTTLHAVRRMLSDDLYGFAYIPIGEFFGEILDPLDQLMFKIKDHLDDLDRPDPPTDEPMEAVVEDVDPVDRPNRYRRSQFDILVGIGVYRK